MFSLGDIVKTLLNHIKDKLDNAFYSHIQSQYQGKKITVTGGLSFIGSNLVDLLIELGAIVTVLDDYSSGKVQNISNSKSVKIIKGDLRNLEFCERYIKYSDVLFHLAAIHGGRGFIETYKRQMLSNLTIDNNVFALANKIKIPMVVHASSACAYPISLQDREVDRNLLSEDLASMELLNGAFADGVYGWTKLIGEYQLMNFCAKNEMKGRAARIFTAYGERENESHAAIALIAKAGLRIDPFPIWGTGKQTRNFTYVGDTCLGLLLLGSDTSDRDFDVFNIGTADHIEVITFVEEIFKQIGWHPNDFEFQTNRPTGVASRASDNTKIQSTFGWQPTTSISEGLSRTIGWYFEKEDRPKSIHELESLLSTR